jgi:hypothetical protein
MALDYNIGIETICKGPLEPQNGIYIHKHIQATLAPLRQAPHRVPCVQLHLYNVFDTSIKPKPTMLKGAYKSYVEYDRSPFFHGCRKRRLKN